MTARTMFAVLTLIFSSYASAKVEPLCFLFKKRITEPLVKPLALKPGFMNYNIGKRADDVQFAGARAVVNSTIKEVYDWLLDHTNWKDMSKTKMKTKKEKKPGYLEFHTVEVDVNVFAFIWIGWTENWAYALVKGTPQAPEEIVISYQKIAGTGHIDRLCGNLVIKKLSPTTTDVFAYEEALADRYGNEQMLDLHVNNLKKLNGGVEIPIPKTEEKTETKTEDSKKK